MRSLATLALISLFCAVFQLGWTFEPSRKFISSALHAPYSALHRFRRDVVEDEEEICDCCGEHNFTSEELELLQKCAENLKDENDENGSDNFNYNCFFECFAKGMNLVDDKGFVIPEKYISLAENFYKGAELKKLVQKYGPECVKIANENAKGKETPCNPASASADDCLMMAVVSECPANLRKKSDLCDEFFKTTTKKE